MNPDKNDRFKECLDRASLITARLKAARNIKETADEISCALKTRMFKPRTTVVAESEAIEPSNSKFPSLLERAVAGESYQLVIIGPVNLRGRSLFEDLVAELVSSAAQTPMPRETKRDKGRSFAFFVAALSAMASSHELHHDLRIICDAARDEAVELATAAVLESHAETLGEMGEGFCAFATNEYKNSIFSRHVNALRKAYNTMINNGINPGKGDVRNEATIALKAEGCPELSDTSKWTGAYAAAGLGELPDKPGKRGPSKHGGG